MIEERFVISWELQQSLWGRIRNKNFLSGILGPNFPGWEEAVTYMKYEYGIEPLRWMIDPEDDTRLFAYYRAEDGRKYRWFIQSLVTSHHQIDAELV